MHDTGTHKRTHKRTQAKLYMFGLSFPFCLELAILCNLLYFYRVLFWRRSDLWDFYFWCPWCSWCLFCCMLDLFPHDTYEPYFCPTLHNIRACRACRACIVACFFGVWAKVRPHTPFWVSDATLLILNFYM